MSFCISILRDEFFSSIVSMSPNAFDILLLRSIILRHQMYLYLRSGMYGTTGFEATVQKYSNFSILSRSNL